MNKILLLALLVFSVACTSTMDTEKTLASADAAYDKFELEESRNILQAVLLQDSLNKEDACTAYRKLALQDWKYHRDYKGAIAHLRKADSIGYKQLDTWLLYNRIEREARHHEKALAATDRALQYALTDNEKVDVKTAHAHTVFLITKEQIEKGHEPDSILLQQSSEELSAILESNSGLPKPSRLQLAIGLVNNQGTAVLNGWMSYFLVANLQSAPHYLNLAAQELENVCKNWKGQPLSLQDQEKLISALAQSRFYEFIPLFVRKNGNKESLSQSSLDIVKYAKYLQLVKEQTDEYYRLIAIDKENERQYKNWLETRKKELWNTLSFTRDKEFSKEAFTTKMRKHFGAHGFDGNTASYQGFNLCLGHIVNQEMATVKQYGYKPEFLYTEVDMMTSNTFPSWFWEDKASGGWATSNEIIRVREVYLSRPFAEWSTVNDTQQCKAIDQAYAEVMQSKHQTISQEQANAVEQKLNLEASKELYSQLWDKGYRDNELKLQFLSTFRTYRTEASVLAHEGRHSIEKKYMPDEFAQWDNEEREFHAKLSQLIFATEPRYELAGMVSSTGDSGHGRANHRIVGHVTSWIEKNKEQIAGYDDQLSPFVQIHLLSKEQIKMCFLEADPLHTKLR